jgi:L-rhamnose-H+ transport protein
MPHCHRALEFLLRAKLQINRLDGDRMGGQIGLGILTVIAAGMLNGSFAAPMKRMSGWEWENSWMLFALSGLIIFPWLIARATVPHLGAVYSGSSASTLVKVILFGLAWGAGSTLFGLGITRVGMALGFALILGITASFGSLLPLAVLHPEQLTEKRGIALIAGTVVMTIGLVLLSLAGRRRERDVGTGKQAARAGFTLGLIICIFSGIFSSMINFSFVFGDELRVRALAAGASSAMAANPIWSLTVPAGFVSNFLYCFYLLIKRHTWALYRQGRTSYWLLGATTGLLWFGGIVVYGMGAAFLGSWGGIIGWPVFMTLDIIAGLFWGAVAGEWKGSSRTTYTYAWAGVAVLLAAIVVIAGGNSA